MRRRYEPLVVSCSIAARGSSSLVQVYDGASYIPDRSVAPTYVVPTVSASATDQSWNNGECTDQCTDIKWLLDGEDISSQWMSGTDYTIYASTTDAPKGTLCIMRNVPTTEQHRLQFQCTLPDTRTGQNITLLSEETLIYTSETAEDTWSVQTTLPENIIYSPLDDLLSLREYQLSHGLTPTVTEAEAKDGNEYLRSGSVIVRQGMAQITDCTVKVFRIAVGSTKEEELSTADTELKALTSETVTIDLRAIPQGTTYIIKAFSSDGTLQAMRNLCSVSRLHKPISVKQVNGTDLYADTASLWQQAIVQHNGEAIEQAERCVRLDLYADTVNETAHWLGEGAYVHFPLDGLSRGNTTDTDYLSTYYDYDYKGEHQVATDASGVAYGDKSGEPYIFT